MNERPSPKNAAGQPGQRYAITQPEAHTPAAPAVPTKEPPLSVTLPPEPCPCGSCHFWKDAEAWHCSDCCPLPEPFLGETCTVSNQTPEPDCEQPLTVTPEPYRVRCADCAHFRPDTIGDGTGIGTCAQGIVPPLREPPLYPNAERTCPTFETRGHA